MKKKTRRNKMTKFIHQKLVGTCIVKELYSKEFERRLDVWQITHQFNFKLFNIFSHNYTVNKKLKYLRFKICLFSTSLYIAFSLQAIIIVLSAPYIDMSTGSLRTMHKALLQLTQCCLHHSETIVKMISINQPNVTFGL